MRSYRDCIENLFSESGPERKVIASRSMSRCILNRKFNNKRPREFGTEIRHLSLFFSLKDSLK